MLFQIIFYRVLLRGILITVTYALCIAEILRLPECGKVDGKFSRYHDNKRLTGHVIASFPSTPLHECIIMCFKFPRCKTFNFMSAQSLCELNSESVKKTGSKLEHSEGWVYVDTPVHQTKVR